ncbi:hypothetical protein J6590_018527 [Homalodisca vitripennis]|nr:hypothetical protein J6590_018527 [Homalodisca vitripennis]
MISPEFHRVKRPLRDSAAPLQTAGACPAVYVESFSNIIIESDGRTHVCGVQLNDTAFLNDDLCCQPGETNTNWQVGTRSVPIIRTFGQMSPFTGDSQRHEWTREQLESAQLMNKIWRLRLRYSGLWDNRIIRLQQICIYFPFPPLLMDIRVVLSLALLYPTRRTIAVTRQVLIIQGSEPPS